MKSTKIDEIEVSVEDNDDEDNDNEDLDDEANDQMSDFQDLNLNVRLQVIARRGRGRPRKEMTGLRERLKRCIKLQMNVLPTDEEAEIYGYLAEVPINRALNGPDAEMGSSHVKENGVHLKK